MTPQEFLDEFGTLAEAEAGTQKLRELILNLAVRGMLVQQNPLDESSHDLLARKYDLPHGYKRKRKIIKRVPVESPDDLFGVLPESWTYAEIHDLYERQIIVDYADGNHGSLYPRKEEFGEAGVTFVSAKDINGGRVIWDRVSKLNE